MKPKTTPRFAGPVFYRDVHSLKLMLIALLLSLISAVSLAGPKPQPSKTIVLVTGAFVSHIGWSEWQRYFESKGYKVLVPAWPHKEGLAEVLRARHPDSAIASLNLTRVIDHYAEIIAKLPEKPIIIGHSFGGLITQQLVQRDLAYAAVAYHSVPAKGVITLKWSFLKSVTPALGLFRSANKTYLMSFKQWQYTFTNGMPFDEQKETYDRLVIPESRRAARAALGRQGKIDFKRPHAPLLFVSGSKDHIIPASLNHSNFKRYRKSSSIIAYKEFEGRNHHAMGQTTWQEDADFILTWVENLED